ncbi:hypothetical protein EVJ58_g11020 [Rhodofomes roseus]|nr:hypothetical protein EVJ58_g11020 [Rhodofomes roseus]
MALEAEPTPLAETIANILKPGQPDGGADVQIASVNGIANGIERMQVEVPDRPNAKDEKRK